LRIHILIYAIVNLKILKNLPLLLPVPNEFSIKLSRVGTVGIRMIRKTRHVKTDLFLTG